LHYLLENPDLTTLYENQAVHRVLEKLCGNKNSSFAEVNKVIAQSIANVSSSSRLPSTRSCHTRKTFVNLVLFPRLHFVVPSLAPFQTQRVVHTVDSITRATFNYDSFLVDINPVGGTYWSGFLAYRGAGISTMEVDYALRNMEEIYGGQHPLFWCYNEHFTSSICKRAPLDSEMSCTQLANTSATRHKFQRLSQKFGALYRRKAFLNTFTDAGMVEMEFQEADRNLRDFVCECVPWNNTTIIESSDDDSEDDDDI
jgi:tubulin beta